MSEQQTHKADPLGYYAILKVLPDANGSLIKQNYRDLAKIWHPDHNDDPQALENFQKLSAAYDTLSDDKKRLVYDLLAIVYTAADFPEIETLVPYRAEGTKSPDLRLFNLAEVRGMVYKFSAITCPFYLTYAQALRREWRVSWLNWLLGWWHPLALLKNVQALVGNYRRVNEAAPNLRLLVHNAVAYSLSNNSAAAAQSAVMALDYADQDQKMPLQRLLALLNTRIPRPTRWNFALLKLVQLSFPVLLLVLMLLPMTGKSLPSAWWSGLFSQPETVDYYQEVSFGARGRTVNDQVIGKILNIPVDVHDTRRLYHLRQTAKIMYGPDDDFDLLKTLPAQTTVRLTGMSPDNVWARVLIDNGEMGFVRFELLQKGIGSPVPDFSKVYQP